MWYGGRYYQLADLPPEGVAYWSRSTEEKKQAARAALDKLEQTPGCDPLKDQLTRLEACIGEFESTAIKDQVIYSSDGNDEIAIIILWL